MVVPVAPKALVVLRRHNRSILKDQQAVSIKTDTLQASPMAAQACNMAVVVVVIILVLLETVPHLVDRYRVRDQAVEAVADQIMQILLL
jgi:hypothetical protein